MIISQRWKDCSSVLLILISRVRVNTNLNSHHFICTKEKGALFQENKNTTLNKRNGVVKVLLTLPILSFKAIEIESKWLFFLQCFNNRRCSFVDIFVVWTIRESSRAFFPWTNGRWVFAEISNSMLKLKRKWSFKRQYCVSRRSGFCDIWSFRDLASLFSFTPSSQYLDFNFQRTQTITMETIVKAKRLKST